jgi:MFS family permease
LWIILTLGFTIAGDLFPEEKRGRLFSRYNAVVALSWGPAGLLVGGPLADLQVTRFAVPRSVAYVNIFYISSIIVAAGTIVFALTVARRKPRDA